ncbi:MAG: GatB/YqeY domain-containing protein [Lachnospiraceae bacterium]|nr:GatB/YqeY domain-containing protein [Lachnospiraceae bacterium]
MSKIETVRAEMVNAMKNKDKERKEILSLLLAALKNVVIDKRADLTEEEENSVVLKEIKQLNDLLEQTPADKGKIMKELMPKVKGKADGKMVNQLVADMFR